jgi:hypothetical protein
VPLNESKNKIRDRWPLSMDLEGIPRDPSERENLLKQRLAAEAAEPQEDLSPMRQTRVTESPMNTFTVDKPTAGETVIDINNPPKKNYNPHDPKNRYPRLMYHHETGKVVKVENATQEGAAEAHGYDVKPSPNHDYSKIRASVAPTKPPVVEREPEPDAQGMVEDFENAADVAQAAADAAFEASLAAGDAHAASQAADQAAPAADQAEPETQNAAQEQTQQQSGGYRRRNR